MPVPRLAYGVGVGQWISETYIYLLHFWATMTEGDIFYWICNQEIGLLNGFQTEDRTFHLIENDCLRNSETVLSFTGLPLH